MRYPKTFILNVRVKQGGTTSAVSREALCEVGETRPCIAIILIVVRGRVFYLIIINLNYKIWKNQVMH